MSRLSIAFLGAALAAALGLTLLQAQTTAAGPATTDLSDPHQIHANGHGADHQGN